MFQTLCSSFICHTFVHYSYLSSLSRSEKFLPRHCLGQHDPAPSPRNLRLPHAPSPSDPPPQSLCHPVPRPQQRLQHLFGQRRNQLCPQQPQDPLAELFLQYETRWPVRECGHPEEVFYQLQADFHQQQRRKGTELRDAGSGTCRRCTAIADHPEIGDGS